MCELGQMQNAKKLSTVLFIEITTAILVLLLLYTGLVKLKDQAGFISQMRSNLLLKDYLNFLSWSIPFSEILVAVLLLIPRFRRNGLLAAGALMASFTIYVGYMLATQSKLPCTCGGIISMLNWKQHLFINTIITAMAFTAFFLCGKRPSIYNRRSRTPANIVGNH